MSGSQTKRWRLFIAFLVIALSFAIVSGVSADSFPQVISLPNGFQPEGIATGNGTTFYVGSIPTGAVYRGDRFQYYVHFEH